MTKFIEVPASKISLAARKLVQGVGVNDASYKIEMVVGGMRIPCPIYRVWQGMIRRCYSADFQDINPAYKGCSVSSEWLLFSCFHSWMVGQDYEGFELDKDVIKSGIKLYSSETCIFVSGGVNKLLRSTKSKKSECPMGVFFYRGRYTAKCSVDGELVHVGSFDTDKEASEAFLLFKSKHVLKIANEQSEPLRGYLTRISKEIASGEYFK